MVEPKTEFGAYVRAERKRLRMSQRELAQRSMVAFTTIQNVETRDRKTTANNRAAILRALEETEDSRIKEPHKYKAETMRLYEAAKDLIRAMEGDLDGELESPLPAAAGISPASRGDRRRTDMEVTP